MKSIALTEFCHFAFSLFFRKYISGKNIFKSEFDKFDHMYNFVLIIFFRFEIFIILKINCFRKNDFIKIISSI